MPRLQYLWLIVPALGLGELGAHVWLSRRAPRVEEWQDLAAPVRRLKRPADLLVVAPLWAEPIARHAFGDGPFPLEQLGRADASTFARAVEVSALGAHSDETRGWRVVSEEPHGRFTLRVLENPAPIVPRYRFIEHVLPSDLDVAVVEGESETPCPFTDRARVSTGGLHGHVAFPRERFQCPGGEASFVGVTVIDDQNYLPRRCIWTHVPPRGKLRLRFARVPLATKIRAWAGVSYFLYRDGTVPPASIAFRADGRALGEHEHRDEWGFRGFSFDTPGAFERTTDLDVEVSSEAPGRDLCFVAESR